MTLGEKLKRARVMKNFTQEYLADNLRVSQKAYSNFENDKSNPDFSQVEKIAKILDMNILDFLSGDNISQNNSEQKGGVALAINSTINQLSEKLIEQYEARIKILEEQLEYWKNKSN